MPFRAAAATATVTASEWDVVALGNSTGAADGRKADAGGEGFSLLLSQGAAGAAIAAYEHEAATFGRGAFTSRSKRAPVMAVTIVAGISVMEHIGRDGKGRLRRGAYHPGRLSGSVATADHGLEIVVGRPKWPSSDPPVLQRTRAY